MLATGTGWRKYMMDMLGRLRLDGDFYMIEQNGSDDNLLHPRGITETAKYPAPKLIR